MNSKKLYLISFLFKILPPSRCHNLKCSLLRWAGAKIGKNVEIMSSAKIIGDFDLIIGDNCFIGHEALIFGPKGSTIVFEDYSKIGSRVILVTGTHIFTPYGNCIEGEGISHSIRICRGSVVSTGSILLPGKTVNEMSHVAAGSVITKDVPAYCRVAGVPAKVIKNFRENDIV